MPEFKHTDSKSTKAELLPEVVRQVPVQISPSGVQSEVETTGNLWPVGAAHLDPRDRQQSVPILSPNAEAWAAATRMDPSLACGRWETAPGTNESLPEETASGGNASGTVADLEASSNRSGSTPNLAPTSQRMSQLEKIGGNQVSDSKRSVT